jgi:peptidoglycan hydrolase-like protein with peptidoglycan-binding domain/DNA invertase Pin-like site-specific DNA recombinase
MRKKIHAALARGLAAALIAALVVIAVPASAEARQGTATPTRALAERPIATGAGYPEGSEAVRALQLRLRRADESPGPIDGLFGPLTEAAVRRFQAREGLAADGLVGPLTAAALRRQAALIAKGAGYGDPQGSERVRALQLRLRRADADPGPIDGRFGPRTEAAVRRFQARADLAASGLVDGQTRLALAHQAAPSTDQSANADANPKQDKEADKETRRAAASRGQRTSPKRERTASERAASARSGQGESQGRRAEAPRPEHGNQARHAEARRARTEPRRGPGPLGPGGASADEDPWGPELPAWDVTLVLALALALLAGALVLARGRSTGKRGAGVAVDYRPLTRRRGPRPGNGEARPEPERRSPPRPPAPAPARRLARPEPAPQERRGERRAPPAPRGGANGAGAAPMLGYAVVSAPEGGVGRGELTEQAEAIAAACSRRGLELLELVREREPRNGKGLERPGLGYACRRIKAGEAGGLVVSELSRLSRSAAELGEILGWFLRSRARLVAVAQGLDTDRPEGRLAALTLIQVSGWERQRLSERTRSGLRAARERGGRRGRPAVADDRELRERIVAMRAEGMTLQAIADRLNEEGVPTVRGGAMWRPSSVQGAVGYKRRPPARLGSLPAREQGSEGER